MIDMTRGIHGSGRRHSRGGYLFHSGAQGPRPGSGGAPYITAPLPMNIPGTDTPYLGMDPSNPLTYVRPWRPRPGMVARLNFDGAAVQENTETGGLWGAPLWQTTKAGVRPARMPR